MNIKTLKLNGLLLMEPTIYTDSRGYFFERFNSQFFKSLGLEIDFVQDNQSHSLQNVFRGLHFQSPPFAQDKLVWVMNGEILDIVVDIRKKSPTFGKWESVTLSDANKQALLVPKGFAHGFLVLSESATFLYKTSNFYSKEHDHGIIWNDPDIGITLPINEPSLSTKDKKHQKLQTLLKQGII